MNIDDLTKKYPSLSLYLDSIQNQKNKTEVTHIKIKGINTLYPSGYCCIYGGKLEIENCKTCKQQKMIIEDEDGFPSIMCEVCHIGVVHGNGLSNIRRYCDYCGDSYVGGS